MSSQQFAAAPLNDEETELRMLTYEKVRRQANSVLEDVL